MPNISANQAILPAPGASTQHFLIDLKHQRTRKPTAPERSMIMLEYATDNHAALKMSVCIRVMLLLCVFSPSLPGRPLKYGGESSSLSITQSPFLPRWRAKKSSALTAGIPYGPYPWPCSQAQHVLMDKCPERIRVFLSRFSAPCSLIVYAACAL